MRSEEDIKNCTTNGVPNETIISSLMSELETLRKAFDLACEVSAFCCCKNYIKHDCDNDCATHWGECFMKEASEDKERSNNETDNRDT